MDYIPKKASLNKTKDSPLWDGNQVGWVKEQIEMNDYIGQRVKLKFRLMSDQFVTYDGILSR